MLFIIIQFDLNMNQLFKWWSSWNEKAVTQKVLILGIITMTLSWNK